jgi:hypothetical protein
VEDEMPKKPDPSRVDRQNADLKSVRRVIERQSSCETLPEWVRAEVSSSFMHGLRLLEDHGYGSLVAGAAGSAVHRRPNGKVDGKTNGKRAHANGRAAR